MEVEHTFKRRSFALNEVLNDSKIDVNLNSIRQRKSPLIGFNSKAHIFSAAHPRTLQGSTTDESNTIFKISTTQENKNERRERIDKEVEMLMKARIKAGECTLNNTEQNGTRLSIVAERLVNENAKGDGLTLLLCHPNGFHKETWDCTLESLLKNLDIQVDEIWLLDCVNHGQSAQINKNKCGLTFDWMDNGRDILTFLTYYLPSQFSKDELPIWLPLTTDVTKPWKEVKHPGNRKVMAIGHSLGGTSLILACSEAPQLFKNLIVIDPIIRPPPLKTISKAGANFAITFASLAQITLARRDSWPSKDIAKELLLKSTVFQKFDRRVLDSYIKYGMIETNNGVTLTTDKVQEAITYLDDLALYESFISLDDVPLTVPILFILASKNNGPAKATLSEKDMDLLLATANNCSYLFIPSGHLIAQEQPDVLGDKIAEYVNIQSHFAKGKL